LIRRIYSAELCFYSAYAQPVSNELSYNYSIFGGGEGRRV
jgi:hypothetical protein